MKVIEVEQNKDENWGHKTELRNHYIQQCNRGKKLNWIMSLA